MIKFQKINDTYVYIEAENEILYELKQYFSFKADGYQFNPMYKYGTWSGDVCLIEKNCLLPLGLLKTAIRYCVEQHYAIDIDDQLKKKETFNTREDFDLWIKNKVIYDKDTIITPYWYQQDSVYEGLKANKLILNLPTQAGKSLIQALLSKYFIEHNEDKKVLIIVPTTALVHQMINDFANYRLFDESECAGIMAGTSKYIYDKSIVVSTWQSACKQDVEWFSNFGMLLVDECHLATGKSISDMTKKMTNCVFKFGLTGSLKDGKANKLQYIGLFGEVFKPVTTKQLMDEGQISKLKINTLLLNYPEIDCKLNKGIEYQKEIKFITEHKRRNTLISKLAVKLAQNNENVLLMFNNSKHGKMLYDIIQNELGYKKIFFINGEIKTIDRVTIQKFCEDNSGFIVVSSYKTTQTGISIKNIHHAIFAHPTKSKVTVLQQIGRTLRLHKSKAIAIMWDIIDNLGIKKKNSKQFQHKNYALDHGMQRIDRYNEEEFEYNITNINL